MSVNKYLDLIRLNSDLAESLRSLQAYVEPRGQGHEMQNCVYPVDSLRADHTSNVTTRYCRCSCCLLCRRQREGEEHTDLLRLLGDALQVNPRPAVVFVKVTLKDCVAAEVEAHATLLVEACGKLLRNCTIQNNIGWTRTIETRSAPKPNEHLENTHAHLILLFPRVLKGELLRLDWESLWRDCAGTEARSVVVEIALAPQAVARYLTKRQAKHYQQDACVGIADPLRYWRRVHYGQAEFSSGGLLTFAEEPLRGRVGDLGPIGRASAALAPSSLSAQLEVLNSRLLDNRGVRLPVSSAPDAVCGDVEKPVCT